MALANHSIPESVPVSPTFPKRESGKPKRPAELERFESVLKLCDTHPFGPKGALARWLDEFSELGDNGNSPPPMA
jgi:hypothetical protein